MHTSYNIYKTSTSLIKFNMMSRNTRNLKNTDNKKIYSKTNNTI